jgi:hypothetical protein
VSESNVKASLAALAVQGTVVLTSGAYLDGAERIRLALSSDGLSPSMLSTKLRLSPAYVLDRLTRLVNLGLAKRNQPDRLNTLRVPATQEDRYTR